MTHHYMVAVDEDHVLILGPFKTRSEAGNAGRQWQRQHEDNPCWMTARLPQGVRSVRFHQPCDPRDAEALATGLGDLRTWMK